jgi:FkbM family methyltransferase
MSSSSRAAWSLRLAAVLRHYPGRGKVALWSRAARALDGRAVDVTLRTGGRMRVDTGKYWQRLMLAEAFERRSAWLLAALLDPGDTFLDGGANCGFYSCLAAGRVGPTGHVIAVEPDVRLHSQLAAQVALNHGVITHVAAALSDTEGTSAFQVPPNSIPDGWGLGIASLEARPGWTSVTVPTTTIDALVAQAGGHIVLAKLDLEGHEAQALRGAAASLSSGALESLHVEINDQSAVDVLSAYQFEVILNIKPGFVEVTDLTTLGSSQADVVFLRGRAAKRWREIRRRSRWL